MTEKTAESAPPQLHLESMSKEDSAWVEGVPGSRCVVSMLQCQMRVLGAFKKLKQSSVQTKTRLESSQGSLLNCLELKANKLVFESHSRRKELIRGMFLRE